MVSTTFNNENLPDGFKSWVELANKMEEILLLGNSKFQIFDGINRWRYDVSFVYEKAFKELPRLTKYQREALIDCVHMGSMEGAIDEGLVSSEELEKIVISLK